jgi:hypothetical protein
MRDPARAIRQGLRTTWPAACAILMSLVLLSPLAVRSQQPPILPDPKLTPGATLPVTKDDICVPGYTQKVRDVPKSVKDQVYAEYGISSHQPREFEVDHVRHLTDGPIPA